MNWKLVILGGIVFYVAAMIVGMFVTGKVIHEGVLDADYRATESFWQPALAQDPPDLGALMPRWIAVGLLTSFITAAIYGGLRSHFTGPGWKRGVKFGLLLTVIQWMMMAGYSGVFHLPNSIWIWWGVDHLILNSIAGAALGWFATLGFVSGD